MTQESVRQKLSKYVDEKGTTLAFIGRKIGVSRQLMSEFKTSKRVLWQSSLERLDEYLKGEGY